MARMLLRLGAGAFRHRMAVALVWLAVLVAGAVGAVTLAGETSNTFAIPGQESTTALERISEEFGAGGGATDASDGGRALGAREQLGDGVWAEEKGGGRERARAACGRRAGRRRRCCAARVARRRVAVRARVAQAVLDKPHIQFGGGARGAV